MSLGEGHYTLGAGEGDAFWIAGDLMTIKAGRAQTGNTFTVGEFISRPGSGPAPHIHHVEDEAFYVLEGALTGFCGDQQWEASSVESQEVCKNGADRAGHRVVPIGMSQITEQETRQRWPTRRAWQ